MVDSILQSWEFLRNERKSLLEKVVEKFKNKDRRRSAEPHISWWCAREFSYQLFQTSFSFSHGSKRFVLIFSEDAEKTENQLHVETHEQKLI